MIRHRSGRQDLRALPAGACCAWACGGLDGCAAMARPGLGQYRPSRPESTMSIHNLFIRRADGTVEAASSQDVLTAARAVLSHRVRRGALLQGPQEVGEYLMMRLGHLDYECFGLILVDSQHRVIKCVELFRGTIDGAAVYPREVVKLALDKGAAAALAYHNHPSGVKDQSQADELITRRLAQSLAAVDVKLLDHLILAGTQILSFAQMGLL